MSTFQGAGLKRMDRTAKSIFLICAGALASLSGYLFFTAMPAGVMLKPMTIVGALFCFFVVVLVMAKTKLALLFYFLCAVLNFVNLGGIQFGSGTANVRPMDLAFLGLFGSWFVRSLPGKYPLRLTLPFKVFSVYVLIAVLSQLLAILRQGGEFHMSALLALIRLLEVYFAYFIFLQVMWDAPEEDYLNGFRLMSVGFIALIVSTAYQVITMSNVDRALFFYGSTGIGALAIIFSGNMLIGIESIYHNDSRKAKLAGFLLTSVFFAALMSTLSRGAILGTILAFAYMVVMRRRYSLLALVSVFMALFAAIFSTRFLYLIRRLIYTFMIGSFEFQTGVVERLIPWENTWKVFLLHPITGVGYYLFPEYSMKVGVYMVASENHYLKVLSETGIIGLTVFLLFFLVLWIKSSHVSAGTCEGKLPPLLNAFRPFVIMLMVALITGEPLVDPTLMFLFLSFGAMMDISVEKMKAGRIRLQNAFSPVGK